MGWKGNRFFYSKRTLSTIAENYQSIYDGLPLSLNEEVTNPWLLAEYKADFDMALNGIGKGKWIGKIWEFKYYRNFGRLQRIIISDIIGIGDDELEGLGFYDVSRLRGFAYYLMVKYLNGDNEKYYNENGGE